MFDIFYFGKKPNLFLHELPVESVEHAQELSRTRFFWIVNYLSDYTGFDFLWEPVVWQSLQRHAWPSQWQKDSETYLIPKTGYTETNYHASPTITRLPETQAWHIPENVDIDNFDFSWHPDPTDPPMNYYFGTQWQRAGGPKYTVPGATDIKFITSPRAQVLPDKKPWHIPENVDIDNFDFSWHPDPTDPPMTYCFGTQWQRAGGPKYTVPGATDIKFITSPRAQVLPDKKSWSIPKNIDLDSFDFSWHPDPTDPPMTYCFGTQWQRSGGPKYLGSASADIKFINQPRAKAVQDKTWWQIPSNVDIDSFDFSWHPDTTEPAYLYQFGTQWQKTGGPRYAMPGATEVKYVTQEVAKVTAKNTAIVEIDHMDGHAGNIPNTVRQVRYFSNYRDTLIRIAKNFSGQYEYVWVCSSICNYTDFDFSWHPEAWQSTMLHVFASNEQKFGDTFFMHVPTFAERAESRALLDWYDVNYVPDVAVPRRAMPVIHHSDDTHVRAVQRTNWAGPLALFTVDHAPHTLPTVSLWRQETKTIVPLSTGASAVIVPALARGVVKTQLYDYPFIDKTERKRHSDQSLDIVFISNGESNAHEHWARLVDHTSALPNQLVHVADVKGRVAAYHAAAQAAATPWFFAVFAKLEIDTRFDWSWQPDRMQEPKHYIFHAANPVNGLVYGHQAMIAYNRDLVLNNPGHGLDFTLDSAHEVVPVLSGVAQYNDTPWMTWRTAFREVLKLKASLPDVESEYRLNKWLEHGRLTNGEWSVWGAEDAVEYYDSVAGDFEQLRKSYDWAWLASYAFIRRNLTPD